ncbi:hypothetical protein HID58_006127, partial [Brassica napus]
KFFETAQLIATHSHLRWPDLSREWIRRQQARIARDGDVNSEAPAQSSPKKKASKAKKRSVPLEEAPSSADVSEVAAKKKKKKKGSKKRSREEASVEKKTTVEDDETSAPGIPSRGGGPATETGDGSRDESPLKDTGDVATEDPVLVSSSEEREEDEVGEEENRSSPALIEETVPIPSVSDPPAQVEGLDAQAVEEEVVEPLDPSRDDQDIVV